MNDLIHYAKHYLFGLVTSTFNGGITGIAALAVMEEQGKLPEGITKHVILHTFAVACLGHAVLYFQANPLPEKLADLTLTTTKSTTATVTTTGAPIVSNNNPPAPTT